MDRLLYIAMSGARQTMDAQAMTANNLANVNTTGFRADLAAMRALPVYGQGLPSRVYAQAQGTGVDQSEGSTVTTGRELDVAIRDRGFIAVQAPDGGEGYTRAGNLKINSAGLLTTASGMPVLGNGGPIAIPPAEKIDIGADGTISILPVGQQASTLAVVDRIKLVNPDPKLLAKDAQGLLRTSDGSTPPPDAQVTVVSGELESSNVNAVEQMVSMIDMARQYEMQIKMMSTDRDNAEKASEILRVA